MPLRRAGGLATAVTLLGLLVAPSLPGATGSRVLAHAQLVASSPGAGEQLEAAPDELRIVFSEPIEAEFTSLDVMANDELLVSRGGTVDPADPYALVLGGPDLPPLPDGVVAVTWRTLSAADGHTAEGTYSFAIGTDATAPAPGGGMTHTDAAPIDVVGRWLTYLGLLVALGVAVGFAVVLRSPIPVAVARLLGLGLLVAGSSTLAVGIANGLDAGAVGDYVLGSRNGLLQLARAAIALVGGAALLLLPRAAPGAIAAATGAIGIVLLVAAGHAAALPGVVAIGVGVAHVAAAAIWFGGVLLLLAVIVRPRLLRPRGPVPSMRALVPRFSALALIAIGFVGVTGGLSAWYQTGVLLDLGTEYGRTLLVKGLLAAAAIGIGAVNFLDGGRMRPWLEGMRSRLGVESILIAAVLAMTAALATTPPVDEAPGVAIVPVPDAFGATTPGMTMTISPGRPGLNRVTVTTTDAMSMISGGLDLVLDRVDTGASTRIPLRLEADATMSHEGMGERGANPRGSDSLVDWVADAVVLPAGGSWDSNVRAVSVAGTELARQRFTFSVDEAGVDDGRVTSLIDVGTVAGAVLLVGGALAIGLALGGGRLPRCEPAASRIALGAGGVVALVLALGIGLERIAAL